LVQSLSSQIKKIDVMKTGILIFLCCVAATYCYSIADLADSIAEKIIAKRESERFFDEEEYVPLENNGDDINAGRPEETGNPGEIEEPLVDFTKDENVHEEVGNPIEAQPIFDHAVANEKTANSPIKSDSETATEIQNRKLANALTALEPTSYKSVVATISKYVLTKEFVKQVVTMMLRMKKTDLIDQMGAIYKQLLTENVTANQKVLGEILDVIMEKQYGGKLPSV